jgi:DNA-binding transcriptional MerR regulator
LLAPFRTEGGTRRYSSHDVERIGQITTLLATGLNLAGVEHVPRRFNGCAGPGLTHG